LLGARYCNNEHKYSQVKLSEAQGTLKQCERCVEIIFMLRFELPVTYALIKLSPRLAGPNADGTAFYGFNILYTKVRDCFRSCRIILVVDLLTVCIDLPSRINVR